MRVIPCVGAVVLDDEGRLLLVRRARPPGEGLWSLPGGRIEPGESAEEALAREVAEETGLLVRVGPPVGRVLREAPGGGVFEIRDFACVVRGGRLRAGDDAAEARWVPAGELGRWPLVDRLLETLREWNVPGVAETDPGAG
jgi:ADP-ribose pyrophosphatase YjhB (NUDIX family)